MDCLINPAPTSAELERQLTGEYNHISMMELRASKSGDHKKTALPGKAKYLLKWFYLAEYLQQLQITPKSQS